EGSAAAALTSGATAATGASLKAAGLYSITHAGSGALMLGSTAAGSSAAGTVGIIAGTSGLLGTIGAVLLSPFVMLPAAAATVGLVVYEGACYFSSSDEGVDD
ncbi:MAG: hypothetical protein Q8L06_04115, partial [Pseudohongiella sp.]|nr:hypothetical protein [Pseudohongiella sp.]